MEIDLCFAAPGVTLRHVDLAHLQAQLDLPPLHILPHPCVRQSGNRAILAQSAPRSDARCAVVCAALGGPTPESRPRMRSPPPSSSAAVPSFSAPSAMRSRSPHAPSCDARPVSWPRPRSFPRRTRTLGGSARTAPLWLSSPTSPPLRAKPESEYPFSSGVAKIYCRTGPDQNTEITACHRCAELCLCRLRGSLPHIE